MAPVPPVAVRVDEEQVVAAMKTVAIPHANGVKKTGGGKSRPRTKRSRVSGSTVPETAAVISVRGAGPGG